MKKAILSIILILVVCISVTACGSKTIYEKVISSLEDEKFDQVSHYSEAQVNEIAEKLPNIGIQMEGKIKNIAHFTEIGVSNGEWIYVYDFELEQDAIEFLEKYASNWENSRQEGTVVIYGKSSLIENIDI
ncbi:MAG: hypothetical protein IJZ04_05220 [Clostridia bacterium]|nr:hypothetical protein [Clostridia bacterium]MBQ8738884.1 hypothetical protein [Clostridia bacterium]